MNVIQIPDKFIAPVCRHLDGKYCTKLSVKCLEYRFWKSLPKGHCDVRYPASYLTPGWPLSSDDKKYCFGIEPIETVFVADNASSIEISGTSIFSDNDAAAVVAPKDVISDSTSYTNCPVETRYPSTEEELGNFYSDTNKQGRTNGKIPHYTNDE